MKYLKLWALSFCLILLAQATSAQSYFQQTVDYRISVKLDDEDHRLTATWELDYTNNSPDALEEIWIHLWPNAYKNNQTALAKQFNARNKSAFLFSKEDTKGYISGLNFTLNGSVLTMTYHTEYVDVAKLQLPNKLEPGETITLKTPFEVKLPDSYSRLGHVAQQYQITQWYPKPAVYDREGWHPMPYLDQGEFFSEFGSFEVKITVPKNYVVGASGQLQDQAELDWLMGKATLDIPENPTDEFPPSSTEWKTLTYTIDNVHDFAWFADKRYIVRHKTTTLPSGRKVDLWSMYNEGNAKPWTNSLTYMEDGIQHYSKYVGEYPYGMATVVDGALSAGAGMEYPTITVLGGSDEFSLEQVIVHELGHNWFYGILGSNERQYPWMDEGMNTYYEYRYFEEKYPGILGIRQKPVDVSENQAGLFKAFGIDQFDLLDQYQIGYIIGHSVGIDQPLSLPAGAYSSINYGIMVYMKTGVAFKMLEAYWGQEKFDRILHAYYQTWKFKHPDPKEIRVVLERESGEDLTWFFEGLLTTDEGLDIALQSVKKEGNEIVATIKQIEGHPGPVPIASMHGNEVVDMQWVNLAAHDDGAATVRLQAGAASKVVIDPKEWLPETNRQNNRSALRGFLPKVEPLRLQFALTAPKEDRTVLHWVPLLGANSSDGFMLGLGLYNATLPEKRFTWGVFPMISTNGGGITGSYRAMISPFKNLVGQNRIRLHGLGQRYSGFSRHTVRLTVDRMNQDRTDPIYQRAYLAGHWVEQNVPESVDPFYEHFLDFGHEMWYTSVKMDWEKNTRFLINSSFWRLENEVDFTFNLPSKGRVTLRNFTGIQEISRSGPLGDYGLYFDGGRDLLREVYLADRNGNTQPLRAYARQTMGEQGGFKSALSAPSGAWLTAFNAEFDIPKALGLGVFADIGWADGTTGTQYDAGVHLKVVNDVFEIYMPLVGTQVTLGQPLDNLRFLLKLDMANPYDLLEKRLR